MDKSKKHDPYGLDQSAESAATPPAKSAASELFSVHDHGGVHVISFERADVLDAFEIERLGDDIYHCIKTIDAPRVVVDLAKVQHLSSSAISMLIALKTVAEKRNGKVAIANVSRDIMEVFKLTKLHKLINIHNDTDKAVSSLR